MLIHYLFSAALSVLSICVPIVKTSYKVDFGGRPKATWIANQLLYKGSIYIIEKY